MLVPSKILEGDRPPQPEHASCTDELWKLIQRCWNQDPRSHPEISQVSTLLRCLISLKLHGEKDGHLLCVAPIGPREHEVPSTADLYFVRNSLSALLIPYLLLIAYLLFRAFLPFFYTS